MKTIGTITQMDGIFYAIDDNGNKRLLKEGDTIFDNDVVVGDNINRTTDSMIIGLLEDGSDIVILGQDSQRLSFDVLFNEATPQETESKLASAIADIVDEEDTEDADDIETAAGEEDSAPSSSGSIGEFLQANGDTVNVESSLRQTSFLPEEEIEKKDDDTDRFNYGLFGTPDNFGQDTSTTLVNADIPTIPTTDTPPDTVVPTPTEPTEPTEPNDDTTPTEPTEPTYGTVTSTDLNVEITKDTETVRTEVNPIEQKTETRIEDVEVTKERDVEVIDTQATTDAGILNDQNGYYTETVETEEYTETVDKVGSREVQETFTNTREVEVEFQDTREVQETFTNTRTETETFTNSRVEQEDFTDTREVSETFTNTRVETQEFQNTRTIDDPDTMGVRNTTVVNTTSMEDAGYNHTTFSFKESFEDNEYTGSWTVMNDKDWNNTHGVEVQNGGLIKEATDGNKIVELDAHQNTEIARDFDTTNSDSLTFSIDYQPRQDSESSNMSVEIDGTTYNFNFDGTVSDGVVVTQGENGWSNYSITIDTPNDNISISVMGAGTSDSLGALIDNIEVSGQSDTWFSETTETFTNTKTVQEDFTDSREVTETFTNTRTETEDFTNTRENVVEFQDTREVMVEAKPDQIIYETEEYVIDDNIHEETFTDTREVTVEFEDTRVITEEFQNTRMVREDFADTREVEVEFQDTRTVQETFTNTRTETEDFQDTRTVQETFTNTRTETQTEEYQQEHTRDSTNIDFDTMTTNGFTYVLDTDRTEIQELKLGSFDGSSEISDWGTLETQSTGNGHSGFLSNFFGHHNTEESIVYEQNGINVTTTNSDGKFGNYTKGNTNVGNGIGTNDVKGLNDDETMTFDISGGTVNKAEFTLSGLGGWFDADSSHATKVVLTATDIDGNVLPQQGGYRTSDDYSDTYTFESNSPIASITIGSSGGNGTFVVENLTLSSTDTIEIPAHWEDANGTTVTPSIEYLEETYTTTETRDISVEVPFEDTRMVEETFTNTRDIQVEFQDTREVQETFTNTRTETEDFTNSRLVEEEHTDTREVSETFTNTRVETEEFQNTRTVDGEDVMGTRPTTVIDSEAMEANGYVLVGDTYATMTTETFTNTRTETETFTDTRDIQVEFQDSRIVTEEFQNTREVTVEFQDTRLVHTPTETDQIIYETEEYIVDDNVYEETFTDTREVTVEFEDTRLVTEDFTNTRENIVEFQDTRDITVEFQDTRTVDETFTNTRTETEEFEDTRTVSEEYTYQEEVTSEREVTVRNEAAPIMGIITETYTETEQQEVEYQVDVVNEDLYDVKEDGKYYNETETTTNDVNTLSGSTTIVIDGGNGGKYGRVINFENDDNEIEFSLGFDKDGTKLRLWNSDNGEQVTVDMKEMLAEGNQFDIEFDITETGASLSVNGVENSINYSSPIELNSEEINIVESPDGNYTVSGLVSDLMIDTEPVISFDNIEVLAQETPSLAPQSNIDLGDIMDVNSQTDLNGMLENVVPTPTETPEPAFELGKFTTPTEPAQAPDFDTSFSDTMTDLLPIDQPIQDM